MDLYNWLENLIYKEAQDEVEFASESEQFNVIDPTAVGNDVRGIKLNLYEDQGGAIIELAWAGSDVKVMQKKFSNRSDAQNTYSELRSILLEISNLLLSGEKQKAAEYSKALIEKSNELSPAPISQDTNQPVTQTQAVKSTDLQVTILYPDQLPKTAGPKIQNIFFPDMASLLEYQQAQQALAPKPEMPEMGPAPVGRPGPGLPGADGPMSEPEAKPSALEQMIDNKVTEKVESSLEMKGRAVFEDVHAELVKILRKPGIGRSWEEIKDFFNRYMKYDWDDIDVYLDPFIQAEKGVVDPGAERVKEDLALDKIKNETEESPVESPVESPREELKPLPPGLPKKAEEYSGIKRLVEHLALDPYALTPDQWASEANEALQQEKGLSKKADAIPYSSQLDPSDPIDSAILRLLSDAKDAGVIEDASGIGNVIEMLQQRVNDLLKFQKGYGKPSKLPSDDPDKDMAPGLAKKALDGIKSKDLVDLVDEHGIKLMKGRGRILSVRVKWPNGNTTEEAPERLQVAAPSSDPDLDLAPGLLKKAMENCPKCYHKMKTLSDGSKICEDDNCECLCGTESEKLASPERPKWMVVKHPEDSIKKKDDSYQWRQLNPETEKVSDLDVNAVDAFEISNGDQVRIKRDSPYRGSERGVFEVSQLEPEKGRCWIGDPNDNDRGWYIHTSELELVEDNELESNLDVNAVPRNEDVIDLFVTDSFPKDKRSEWGTPNLKIKRVGQGWALFNYYTPMMYRDSSGKLYFNAQNYSQTTSRIQNMIRNMASGFREVDEAGIKSAIDRDVPSSLQPGMQDVDEEGRATHYPSGVPKWRPKPPLKGPDEKESSLCKSASKCQFCGSSNLFQYSSGGICKKCGKWIPGTTLDEQDKKESGIDIDQEICPKCKHPNKSTYSVSLGSVCPEMGCKCQHKPIGNAVINSESKDIESSDATLTDEQVKENLSWKMYREHWKALNSDQQQNVDDRLEYEKSKGVKASLRNEVKAESMSVECLECGKKFKTRSSLPSCPNCGGSDIDLASSLGKKARGDRMQWGDYELEYYEEGGHNLWTLTLKNIDTDETLWHTDDLDTIASLFEDGFLDWKKPEQSIKYLLEFNAPAKKNANTEVEARNSIWVGLPQGSFMDPGAKWEVFNTNVEPTQDKFPQYSAIIGPFKTKEGAEFMAMYGKNNPHCQTVYDAEKLAHSPNRMQQPNESVKQSSASTEAQEFISKHIKKHLDEGMEENRAKAAAYEEARKEGFDVPAPKKEAEPEKKCPVCYGTDEFGEEGEDCPRCGPEARRPNWREHPVNEFNEESKKEAARHSAHCESCGAEADFDLNNGESLILSDTSGEGGQVDAVLMPDGWLVASGGGAFADLEYCPKCSQKMVEGLPVGKQSDLSPVVIEVGDITDSEVAIKPREWPEKKKEELEIEVEKEASDLAPDDWYARCLECGKKFKASEAHQSSGKAEYPGGKSWPESLCPYCGASSSFWEDLGDGSEVEAGRKYNKNPRDWGKMVPEEEDKCAKCSGSGWLAGNFCSQCGGTGVIKKEELKRETEASKKKLTADVADDLLQDLKDSSESLTGKCPDPNCRGPIISIPGDESIPTSWFCNKCRKEWPKGMIFNKPGLAKKAETGDGFCFSGPEINLYPESKNSACAEIWEQYNPESRKQLLSQLSLSSDLYVKSWDQLEEEARQSIEKHLQFGGKKAEQSVDVLKGRLDRLKEDIAKSQDPAHKSILLNQYALVQRQYDMSLGKSVNSSREREELADTLQPFDVVQRASTGDKGLVLQINDQKPGDIDVCVFWFKPHLGKQLFETDLGDLKRLPEIASPEMREKAEDALKQFKKDRKEYEKEFENKIKDSANEVEKEARPKQMYTLEELNSMQTLSQGHMDDLKYDDGQYRVWLSRMTVEDGAQYNNQVTVEKLIDGRWKIIEAYEPGNNTQNIGEHRSSSGIIPCDFCGQVDCDYDCDESQAH